MSMTLSGDGTIIGLAAGGLPDGTIQPSDLSTGAPTWNTSGNVGIGTSSLVQKLTISDTIPSNHLALTGGQQNAMQFQSASGTGGFIVGRSLFVDNANDFFIYDAAASATRMTVDSAGTITSPLGGMQVRSGTSVSASGTAVNFTGIPSWVKKITVMLSGVSTNGTTSDIRFRIGTSGGVVSTGYANATTTMGASVVVTINTTDAFTVRNLGRGTDIANGIVTLTNITGNTWVASGVFAASATTTSATTAGSIALGATLDRVQITMNGTDVFDAGTINILYE